MGDDRYYIGCIVCGISRDAAKSEKCWDDAQANGVKLAEIAKGFSHSWTEMFEPCDWYMGRGVTKMIREVFIEKEAH